MNLAEALKVQMKALIMTFALIISGCATDSGRNTLRAVLGGVQHAVDSSQANRVENQAYHHEQVNMKIWMFLLIVEFASPLSCSSRL